MTTFAFVRKFWPFGLIIAFGFVIFLTQVEPPSATIAERNMMKIIRPTTSAEIPNGMGCEKAIRKSCISPRC